MTKKQFGATPRVSCQTMIGAAAALAFSDIQAAFSSARPCNAEDFTHANKLTAARMDLPPGAPIQAAQTPAKKASVDVQGIGTIGTMVAVHDKITAGASLLQ